MAIGKTQEHRNARKHQKLLLSSLETFDEQEPMMPESRKLFRYQLAPLFRHLSRLFMKDEHYEYVERLVNLWDLTYRVLSITSGTEEPLFENDKPLKRCELAKNEQKWRP